MTVKFGDPLTMKVLEGFALVVGMNHKENGMYCVRQGLLHIMKTG